MQMFQDKLQCVYTIIHDSSLADVPGQYGSLVVTKRGGASGCRCSMTS